MGGNPKIVVPDHFASALEFGADDAVRLSRIFQQEKGRKDPAQCTQAFQGSLALRTLHRPINRFTIRDHRDARFPRSNLLLRRASAGCFFRM